MLDFLQRGSQPRSEIFQQLTIERRVLITPGSTISIPTIASVSTGTVGIPRKALAGAALTVLATALLLLAAGYAQGSGAVMAIGTIGAISGLALLPFAKRQVACLSIASTGGHLFLFTGQRKTLEEARRLLSDKISSGDENAAYRIHFEKGIVHPLGQPEPVGALFAPPLNQPTLGNGHFGAVEPLFHAAPPPTPQLRNGHAGVDYAPVLAQIVDMQRFYGQRPDTQDIAERLSEMEYLMRSGTPTPGGRARVDQLAAELSSILGAYPHVVQIFHHAARLASM